MGKRIIKMMLYAAVIMSVRCNYFESKIPDVIYINPEKDAFIESMPYITLKKLNTRNHAEPMNSASDAIKYSANLLGIFPVKETVVVQNEERYVYVSGKPFGIKMFCDGVMVVGFSDILTQSGYKNPARTAGLKIGDIITHINNVAVQTNEEVEKQIKNNESESINITYLRDDKELNCSMNSVKDINTDKWRTGMWVRDSGAGIGTMTFYDDEIKFFAGLGHGIKDVDTQQELRLLSGEIVPVKITGIVKSKNGSAGQLKGSFMTTIASGKILHNGITGVCGKAYTIEKENLMPVAAPSEIQTGPAYILTTINGTQPQKYEITIEKVNLTSSDLNKNMIIRVTDRQLLTLTGGIVRGFSGSPIIQNGKLVGAVTHVFVNQVDKGYGIFASNMLNTVDRIATEEKVA